MTIALVKVERAGAPSSLNSRESRHLDRFLPVYYTAVATDITGAPTVLGAIIENEGNRPSIHALMTALNILGTDCKVYGHINPGEAMPANPAAPTGWHLLATLAAIGDDVVATGLYAKYLLVFDLAALSDAAVAVAMGCAG